VEVRHARQFVSLAIKHPDHVGDVFAVRANLLDRMKARLIEGLTEDHIVGSIDGNRRVPLLEFHDHV
jgi:hypothetical protein